MYRSDEVFSDQIDAAHRIRMFSDEVFSMLFSLRWRIFQDVLAEFCHQFVILGSAYLHFLKVRSICLDLY
ncbi:Uncharacterised protein [Segatella copri]|nr:Uncharacterised protein [Segatella copri]